MADASRESAALIEDFFTVNEMLIDSDLEDTYEVSFCVEGPSVIDFSLASSDVNSGVYSLVIDNVTVAQAEFFDMDGPSNLSLQYRGQITEDSLV